MADANGEMSLSVAELEALYRNLSPEERDDLLRCLLIAAHRGGDAMTEVLEQLLMCRSLDGLLDDAPRAERRQNGLDGCDRRFHELALEVFPGYMNTLQERVTRPWPLRPLTEPGVGPATFAKMVDFAKDIMGCYVFVEGERPVYVGISKHVFARVLEHVRGTDHYTATLAYQMAMEKHPHGMTASLAINDPEFRPRFLEYRDSLRDMSVAFVEIPNPLELYLFEPYCAMELGTGRENQGWNTFVTH